MTESRQGLWKRDCWEKRIDNQKERMYNMLNNMNVCSYTN